MRPIWNPAEGGRARVKASIRYVTLIDNIFQGIFTKRPFERERHIRETRNGLRQRKKHCAIMRYYAKRQDYVSREASIEYVELPERTDARSRVCGLAGRQSSGANRCLYRTVAHLWPPDAYSRCGCEDKESVSPTILVNCGFTRANREIGVPGAVHMAHIDELIASTGLR
jgi:hypothetical protein